MRKLLWLINSARNRYLKLNIAVRASLWFAICSFIQKGISVITLPIFTRIMSTEQYGEYNIFLTWFNIVTIITTLNIQLDIFNKGLAEHEGQKDEYTANQAGLLIALTVLFSTVYLFLQKPINNIMGLSTGLVLVMLIEVLANAMITLWSARKRFSFEYKSIVLVTLITSLANPLVGVFAVLISEDKATARIVSNAAVSIVIAICLLVMICRKGKLFKSVSIWKVVVFASIPLLPHYLSLVLLNQSDKLMIDYFIGKEQVAIYSIAHSAGLLMTIVNTSINGSFVPWAYKKIKDKDQKDIKRITNLILLIVLVVNLYVIWLAPEVIKVLAAPQYAEAIWCLVPIAMSVFFFFIYTLFVDIEIYYGANKYIAVASVVAAVLNIILNYLFIPIFGYIVAGYTTLVSYFFTMILHYIFMRHTLNKMKVSDQYFDYRMIMLLSIILIVFSTIALFLYRYTVIRLAVAVVCTIVIFIERKKFMMLFAMLKGKSERS